MSLDLPVFPGKEHFIRCFNHTVNLVGKSLLKLFEVPKQANESNDAALDAAEDALRSMAKDIDMEDLQTQLSSYASHGSVSVDDPDNIFNEVSMMTDDEATEFRESVLPICCALVKVRIELSNVSSSPKHSDTQVVLQNHQLFYDPPSQLETPAART
jgi:hypothetical protein